MERRIIPITTELEYAPVTRDHLAEVLGGLSCFGECELPRCFEDRHHFIYGQDLTEAERLFKSHPDNIDRVCRSKHEQTHVTWKRSEPISDQTAIDYLKKKPSGMTGKGRTKLKELERRINGR